MEARKILLAGLMAMVVLFLVPANNNHGAVQAAPKKGAKKKRPAPKKSTFNQAACNAYLDRLHAKLDQYWMLPDGNNRVTISAVVKDDGSLDNVETSSSPKNADAEQAGNEAFVKSQPLEPLPAGTGQSVTLNITFSSVSTQHESNRSINLSLTEINK